MYTFGPLIAKNSRNGRLLGGAPVTVTTLDGTTLDTYTVDERPLTLVTNHEGYAGTFTADTDQRVILARPRGGDPLPLYAHEAIGDAAEAADTINTGRLSEAAIKSTIDAGVDEAVPGAVAQALAEDDTVAQAAAQRAGEVATDPLVAGVLDVIGGDTRKRIPEVINVRGYGAVGDATSDDTAAIEAALADAPTDATVTFPVGASVTGGYRVTAPIVVPPGVNLDMHAPLIYDGPPGEAALTVGPAAAPGQRRANHTLRVRRAAYSDWTDEFDCGLRLRNHSYSHIRIAEVTGFTVGVRASGENVAAFAYNEVELGELRDNRISLELTQTGNGWTNENNFYGGSFTVATGTHPSLSRVGVRITSDDSSYLNQNNNVFHKPSFEIKGWDNPDPHHGLCALIVHGNQNRFLDARHESPSRTAMLTLNESQNNTFTTGYNMEGARLPRVEDTGTLPSSVLRLASRAAAEASTYPVKIVDNLHKRACYYDGSSAVNIPGVTLQSSTVGDYIALGGIDITDDYIQLPNNRGVGIYVSTRNTKRFTLLVDSDLGYGGRVIVRAHAADGSVLGAEGPQRVSHIGAYGTIFGGAYRTGSDNDGPRFFTVADDVDHIFVGVAGGSNQARVRGFTLMTPDLSTAATWLRWSHNETDGLATTPPTAGTWERGRRLLNANPAPGQPQGWVCTSGGEPGTWAALPSL